MLKKSSLLIAIASVFTMIGCQTSNHATVQKKAVIINHEAASHEGHGHKAHWGYGEDGSIAPEQWGDIEVNKLCEAGVEQSPIDINTVRAQDINSKGAVDLVHMSHTQNFTIANNGHTIVYNATDTKASKITVKGKQYSLLQFHYHIPSEHTVMNNNYPLEIHFVHQSSDGMLAVVGVLFNVGAENSSLAKVINNIPPNKADAHTKLDNFDIASLMPSKHSVYAYNGSLTTPPCSEKVQWLLKSTPVDASAAQITTLANLYKGNNRPVQPIGSRKVLLVK